MKKSLLILLSLTLILIACKKQKSDNVLAAPPNPIFNTWEFIGFDDNEQYMLKADQLPEEKYGFIMEPEGKFIEMRNSQECSSNGCFIYKIYEGSWTYLGNNTYHIVAPYYGGVMEFNMQIKSIKNDTLRYEIPFSPVD